MIISDSKIGMSSAREYSRQFTRRSYDSKSNGISFFMKLADVNELYEEKQSYNGGTLDSFESQDNDNDFFTPIYNQDGIFSTDAIVKKADHSNTIHVKSISEMYAEVTRRLYLSLLELIDSLKLRGMVYDDRLNSLASDITDTENSDASASNTSSTGSIANDSDELNKSDTDKGNYLSITNSKTPTRWINKRGFSTTFSEKEYTTFSTTGTVITGDGREISFGLDCSMSREYMETFEVEYTMKYDGIFTDPLVINLDNCPVSISDQSFTFDINADGEPETIAMMNSSSGFLALDKNNDGIINDGSELFGPASGNGFNDLSQYDMDGNGWIDEADDVYSQLKVWIKDENGNDRLLSLKEADVGAICLQNSTTDFSLKSEDNTTLGKVRRTGIYLHENGTAGSVQQVDF